MKRLEVFLLPLDGILVHHRSPPCNLLGFPNNYSVPIYTPRWPGLEARGRTARSVDERTNHEAIAPLLKNQYKTCNIKPENERREIYRGGMSSSLRLHVEYNVITGQLVSRNTQSGLYIVKECSCDSLFLAWFLVGILVPLYMMLR